MLRRLHSSRRRCNCHWTSHLSPADTPPPTNAVGPISLLLVFVCIPSVWRECVPNGFGSILFGVSIWSPGVCNKTFWSPACVFLWHTPSRCVAFVFAFRFRADRRFSPDARLCVCRLSAAWCGDSTPNPFPSFSSSARPSIGLGIIWLWRASAHYFGGNIRAVVFLGALFRAVHVAMTVPGERLL